MKNDCKQLTMKTKLQLPQTIRLVTLDDPAIPEIHKSSIEAAENNNIVEGYILYNNLPEGAIYKVYAEINIDNDRLWTLFKKMLMTMPDEVSLITEHKDDEPNEAVLGAYGDKYSLLNKLEKYEKELAQDGFMRFGVIHNTAVYLEEVFVHNAKYIRYWGMDLESFENLMVEFSLYPIDNLEFVDSYPMVTTVLTEFDRSVLRTEELLAVLRNEK